MMTNQTSTEMKTQTETMANRTLITETQEKDSAIHMKVIHIAMYMTNRVVAEIITQIMKIIITGIRITIAMIRTI